MGVIESSLEIYKNFINSLPPQAQIFINLLILTIIVVIYAVFIWKFYVFISTKNILRLNLNKYNRSTHPILVKVVAGLLYVIEYIIILPLLIFFWFAFFTILLTLLTKGLEPSTIVLIAAITIAVIRVTAYIPKYGESVSSEVAKIIPLTLLAISLTNPLFFQLGETLNQIAKIPLALGEARFYIFFIIAIELILRVLTFIGSLFKGKGGTEIEEAPEEVLEEKTETQE